MFPRAFAALLLLGGIVYAMLSANWGLGAIVFGLGAVMVGLNRLCAAQGFPERPPNCL